MPPIVRNGIASESPFVKRNVKPIEPNKTPMKSRNAAVSATLQNRSRVETVCRAVKRAT